jgi:hypothetical protein
MSEDTLQTILSNLRTLRYNQTSIIESLLLLSDTLFYQSQRYEMIPRFTPSRYPSRRSYEPFVSSYRQVPERRPNRSNNSTNNPFTRINPDRNSNIEISFMDNSNLSTPDAINQLMSSVFGTSVSQSLSLNTIQDKTEVIHYSDIETPGESMCSICRLQFDDNSIIRKIKHCNHYFHINCIDNWFKENKTCPVCRYDLTSEETNQPRGTNL